MGRVIQINVSPGGLPKTAVPAAAVEVSGVEGDRNVYRMNKRANTPDQALLVLPMETLQQLRQEGWPVGPGLLGENLTTQGIAYSEFRPGDVFRVGSDLEIQITLACDPCSSVKRYGEGFIKAVAGRRGWYAKVLKPGRVQAGDPIVRVSVQGS